jgi:hypothetical protein
MAESGYNVCTQCGKLGRQTLDTRNVVYNHQTSVMVRPYSRKSRFEKKVLGLLRCLVNYQIDERLVFFLKHRKIETPEDLHTEIGLYPTKGRRPFDSIMYYWVALNFEQPMCTETDILFLKQDFDNIFFAWDHYGYPNPKFPYSYLFRKIVMLKDSRYSKGMRIMTRFVRRLQCAKRRKRYDKIFKRCACFDYKNMDQKVDENEVDVDVKQTVSIEKIRNPLRISPYDVKNVYKTKREMDQAVANGTFKIEKTMHMDIHGRMFFLAFS